MHTGICAHLAEELGGATPVHHPADQVFPLPVRESDSPLLLAAGHVDDLDDKVPAREQ